MNALISEEVVSKIDSFNGINIYKIRTEKFKTNSINIFFHDNLTREHVTLNSLLPAVLRRGCERFKTFQDIAQYLEDLYGASFDCGVSKKGERQIIQYYIEYISDEYTGENTNLFEDTFEFLYEIITNPVLEDGYFKKDYLEQEKENLKQLIEGRVNDKVSYAVEKCIEEMCSKEPFGIFENGFVSDLASIDSRKLYEHYKYFLETLPIDIYITGNVDNDKINKMVKKFSLIKRREIKKLDSTSNIKEVKEVRNFEEKMSVNQAKLSLGFRTGIMPRDKEYYTLFVCNTILGGGMHSKLFQNVREKASLAYYAFSRLDKFKGLMLISSGIEIGNKEKALKIILEQLDEIKKGNISDYEFDSTIKTIETGIKSIKDSQLQMVDFYLSQSILNSTDSLNDVIEKVKKVKREDIVIISQNIKLDSIYFLTSNEEIKQ